MALLENEDRQQEEARLAGEGNNFLDEVESEGEQIHTVEEADEDGEIDEETLICLTLNTTRYVLYRYLSRPTCSH